MEFQVERSAALHSHYNTDLTKGQGLLKIL
jgi:hypothetical protein